MNDSARSSNNHHDGDDPSSSIAMGSDAIRIPTTSSSVIPSSTRTTNITSGSIRAYLGEEEEEEEELPTNVRTKEQVATLPDRFVSDDPKRPLLCVLQKADVFYKAEESQQRQQQQKRQRQKHEPKEEQKISKVDNTTRTVLDSVDASETDLGKKLDTESGRSGSGDDDDEDSSSLSSSSSLYFATKHSLNPLWSSAIYVVLFITFEHVSYYGIYGTEDSYLIGVYKSRSPISRLSADESAIYTSITMALAYTMPLVGGILGDGKRKELLFSYLVFVFSLYTTNRSLRSDILVKLNFFSSFINKL